MLPELRTRFDAIEQRRHAHLERLATLDDTLLRYHPAPRSWSMLQVTEHLVLLEQIVVKAMIREPRPDVHRRWWHRIGAWMVTFVFRYGFRVPAPTRKVVPTEETPLERSAERWSALRSQMAAFLESATPERARVLGWRHPVAGPLDVASTLDFVATHHDHHLRQIARIEKSWESSQRRQSVMS
jgi:uncharacterized damage-inducible protein DinB